MAHLNPFVLGGEAMLAVMLVTLAPILRDTAVRRIIAAQVLTLFGSIALMLFAIGFDRPDFCDLGLALGLLSFGGTLCYAQLLERWL